YLYKVGSTLNSIADFAKSKTALASNNPRILLNGIAGSGKTHFLCDLGKHRVENGLPTFIFLGEEFNSKAPWDTVKSLIGVSGSDSDFLKSLNHYASTKRTRFLIVIDALNESQISGI